MSNLRPIKTDLRCYRANNAWHVALETSCGRVVVRPRFTNEPLDGAYRLAYEVLCQEKRLVSAATLSSTMRALHQKWDQLDLSAETVHLMATIGGEVVGRMRIIKGNWSDLPLVRNGFKNENDERTQGTYCEIGKLMLAPKVRGGGLVTAFFRLAHQIVYIENSIPSVFLSCEPELERLYRRLGGVVLGKFFNSEFQKPYTAMRIDCAERFEAQGHRGAHEREERFAIRGVA
jgi:predicted GNAT family N-acyltransferase